MKGVSAARSRIRNLSCALGSLLVVVPLTTSPPPPPSLFFPLSLLRPFPACRATTTTRPWPIDARSLGPQRARMRGTPPHGAVALRSPRACDRPIRAEESTARNEPQERKFRGREGRLSRAREARHFRKGSRSPSAYLSLVLLESNMSFFQFLRVVFRIRQEFHFELLSL